MKVQSLDPHISASEPWANKIRAAWQKTTENIIETGRLVSEAKKALEHGEFEVMVERDLPFGPRLAQMLMKVSGHPILTEAKHIALLPPHVSTLYELTKLPEKTLSVRLADGTISPKLERKDVGLLRAEHVELKARATKIQKRWPRSGGPMSRPDQYDTPENESDHSNRLEEARTVYVKVLKRLTAAERSREIFQLMDLIGMKVRGQSH